MHDFIQNLSFNSQSPFRATRPESEALRSLTRSFNELPHVYHPSPRPVSRRKPARSSRKS